MVMKATHSLNISQRIATLTVLAAACTMAMTAQAAETDNTNTTESSSAVNNVAAAPSAVDSSRRIIRRAQPSAAVSTATPNTVVNPTANSTTNPTTNLTEGSAANTVTNVPAYNAPAQSSTTPTTTMPSSSVAAATAIMNGAAVNTPAASAPPLNIPASSLQPYQVPQNTGATPANQANASLPATRVYQREAITVPAGVDLSRDALPNIPTPQVQLSAVSFVPTILIPQQQDVSSDKIDVSLLDYFIADVSPNARHYPPNFPNRSQRHYTREKIRALSEWIQPYAEAPNASYEVLIRAAKLNGMGRNLDLGSDYTIRGGRYVDRAIKLDPNSGEANFLYGMMLAEGGGFKEGQKYLDRAAALGYTEAEQSLAQSDLLNDRRSNALERLRRLEQQDPNNEIIRQQIKIIEDGKYYIWDIPAPDIDVKPTA